MSDRPPPRVTVVIPVYRGAADVARCLDSVRRHAATTTTSFEVLVIDDASPEPDVVALLDGLDVAGWPVPLTVLHHRENLGFVATVNEGFAAAAGDVVVLNADTVVTAGWLDRLAAAASGPAVATVTPLSGFGSICTLPESVRRHFNLTADVADGPESSPDGRAAQIDECAEYVAANSLGLRPEVITGVGFCMYVTRGALDAVGLFDVETFGTGYGEEVDFCLRASGLGWRHLVEDATFVHHRGAGSFGADERARRMTAVSERLHRRHPMFRAANRAERAANPLAVPFAALELGLAPRDRSRPHVLHVLHSPPQMLGGTEQHVMALLAALADDLDASILYHLDSGFVLRTLWRDPGGAVVEHEYLFPGAQHGVTKVIDDVAGEALASVLELFDFDAVHIQNLVGHSLAPLEVLRSFEGPVVCSVRDLYLACPHHWLLTPDRQPCGLPDDLTVCAECLPRTRDLERADLEEFRAIVEAHLDVIDRWVFASQSACDYLLRTYDLPPDRVEIIPHGSLIEVSGRRREIDDTLVLDQPFRLGFVGVGWAKKGLDVVNELADALAGSGIEIHHFGKLKTKASPNLLTHGPYDNSVLPELLADAGIQAVLLPVPYAETFGHTLTEALVAGLPVIGTSYGALGERIRAAGIGWTVDPGDVASIVALVRDLDRGRLELRRATEAVRRVPLRPVADTADRYAALYRAGATTRPPAEEETAVTDEEQRLRRQLRALASVNRRLSSEVAELRSRATKSTASVPPAPRAALSPRPPTTAHETDPLTMATPAVTPHLTRRSDGLVFIVDSSGRRKVKSGLLAATLEAEFGAPKPDTDDAYGPAGEVETVAILLGSKTPFVVINGKRWSLKGLPLARPVSPEEFAQYPEGGSLDMAKANVARSRLSSNSANSDLKSQVKRVIRGVERRVKNLRK